MVTEVRFAGDGTEPAYGSGSAAGADLRASAPVAIAPGAWAAVSTGLRIEIPEGCVGLVWPRSGLALRQGIDTLAGVIDSDYRGEVQVLLVNHGEETVWIEAGDRIAQLLVQRVERVTFRRVSDLEETSRGSGGFGSTGR